MLSSRHGVVLAVLVLGCADKGGDRDDDSVNTMGIGPGDDDGDEGDTIAGSGSAMGEDTGVPDDDGPDADEDGGSTSVGAAGPLPVKFDLGAVPDGGQINTCGAPSPVVCDGMDDDPWHALGLNCPGGPQVGGTYTGYNEALHVHEGNIGTYNPPPFPPREGTKIVIMSSGHASDLLQAGLFASNENPGNDPFSLPPPMTDTPVSPTEDCADNPGLVGTGDCSNTISAQWNQGNGAFDYAELRITAEVPAATFGFSYDLAMFSTEYPVWYHTAFNDMYIAWLESEQWTGNVSFDEAGNPISLNAGFLDYKDAPNPYDCPAPCTAPELQGTAMQGHAGTKWLTTTAGVVPGETMELVMAVFDLSDNVLDTVVLLDNWHWECEGGPPVTIPG
jgi:hypothetical protein